MYGEYLATRALALAAAGKPGEALLVLPNVRRMTSVAEVRTLIATTEAITAIGTPRAQAAAAQALELAIRLNTWDALVCGVRAVPRLLDAWALNSAHRRYVVAMLRRSHDDSLMRAHGLSTGRNYTRGGILSPREREVIDLIRQGLTNREIAHTLYISEATAKVHVQHVLEKLGARTRAEAVALYADETSIGPRRTVSDTG
jgi:DNA-binding CsgD family transcriptional regulator